MAATSQLISLIESNSLTIEEYSILTRRYFQKEYNEFITFVIQELDIDYESRVLDIGCGPGWVSLELGRRLPDSKIIGFDFNENIIQVANQNKRLEKLDNVEFVSTNQNNLEQFTDRFFDAVISFNVLHFLDNQKKILNEINRVLKKKGRYAIADNRSDLKILAKAAIWFNARTMPKNFRLFWKESFRTSHSLTELVNLLLKTKLKDWKIRSSLFDFLIYKM